MNTTRIPGFSAEAAVYPSGSRYYGSLRGSATKGAERTIHLAMLPNASFYCQNDVDGNQLCCFAWVLDANHFGHSCVAMSD
jgi:hypothetical protein